MEIESIPVTRLQKSAAQMNAKLAMYQEMNSKVLALKTASEKLGETDLYRTMGASTADTSIFTSTADKTAAPGTHEVVVKQLGTSSVRASSGSVTYLDTTKTLDQAGYRTAPTFVNRTVGSTSGQGGAFTINGTTVDYWKTDTLDDVIARINSTVSGVTASYDSTADKLVLTRSGGGSIQISDTVGNFVVANGFANNQVGSGTLTPNTRAGKIVRADMKLSEAFTTPVGDGVMSINGVAIAVKQDETIQQLIDKINRSGANVTASFSTTENTFKLTGKNMGSTEITMGSDSSGLARADLLILDDWALHPLEGTGQHALLEVIDDRTGIRSTLVT
ncbi:MAG: hypothetical protein FJX76_23170, partial [Armatimonadetes bacterium]|nr:hypothetical protein [Armatimonadota bacterium]